MRNIQKILILLLALVLLTGCSSKNASTPSFDPDDPLRGVLPETFVLTEYTGTWDPEEMLFVRYEDNGIRKVYFFSDPIGGNLMIDIENAAVKRFSLKGYDAVITEEDIYVQLLWLDEELEVYFTLYTINVEAEQVIRYAEDFIDSLYG